jgi:hypothetical protein
LALTVILLRHSVSPTKLHPTLPLQTTILMLYGLRCTPVRLKPTQKLRVER